MSDNHNWLTEEYETEKPGIDLWALFWGAVFSAPLWFLVFLWIVKSHGG